MRAGALVLLSLLAGCDGSPCDGYGASCVALTVEGSGALDALAVTVSGALASQGVTARADGAAFDLPTRVALHLGDVAGDLTFLVEGRRAGARVGVDLLTLGLARGQHVNATARLSPAEAIDGSAADLAPDAGARDLAADGPPPDASETVDGSAPDLSAPSTRILFVTADTYHGGHTVAEGDQLCAAAAALPNAASRLSGRRFLTLRSRPTIAQMQADLSLDATSGRVIVDPNGQVIIAEADLVGGGGNSPGPVLDQYGAGVDVTNTACVWTGSGSAFSPAPTNCLNWTSLSDNMTGGVGIPGGDDWRGGGSKVCALGCHLYCLEVP